MQVGLSRAALFFLAVVNKDPISAFFLLKGYERLSTRRRKKGKEKKTWYFAVRRNNNVGVIRDIWAVWETEHDSGSSGQMTPHRRH